MRRRYMIGSSPSMVSTITINQLIGDPYSRVTGDINGEAIQWIRQNSHNYLCKYKEGMMYICQLKDSNNNYYHDGSYSVLGSLGVDVMMKLPIFYTKSENVSSGVWNISFSTSKKDGMTEWGGDLIGAFEGFVNSDKLYSLKMSGSSSTAGASLSNFRTYARNRGNGFTLVKWKHHNIMAFLYYAMYGNTDSQGTIGSGTDSYAKELGVTSNLGMTDTVAGENGDNNSIKFWGLENWWGNKAEFIDNVLVNPVQINGVWRITEDDGTTRDLQGLAGNNLYPMEFIVGDHLDCLAKSVGGNSSSGYCDSYSVLTSKTGYVVYRSGSNNSKDGGVSFLSANILSTVANNNIGTRLAFQGPMTEIENVAEFKSL